MENLAAQNEVLHGGREGKITKAADKVIRPANPWTSHVHAFLAFMHENGFTQLPKPYGLNSDGMEMISYVEGTVYNDCLPDFILTDDVLMDAARFQRRYHDLAESYMSRLTGEEIWMLPRKTPTEVMCHGDFAPYNTTFVDGRLYGIIDFDTLHPGPKLWDIAYTVYRWVPFVSPLNSDYRGDLENQIRRLKLFADTYGLSREDRLALPAMMITRLQSLVNFMLGQADDGNEDFRKNIEDGHVRLYLDDIQYLKDHTDEILAKIL